MAISSVTAIGLEGIKRGSEEVAERATEIASGTSEDLVGSIIGLELGAHQVEASTKVVKVGDELLGAILDILG